MTYEEKLAVVAEMEKKHNIPDGQEGDVMRAKVLVLAEALLAMGYGRNASTITALRFTADMMESAIPHMTPEQLVKERLERQLAALDPDDLPKA